MRARPRECGGSRASASESTEDISLLLAFPPVTSPELQATLPVHTASSCQTRPGGEDHAQDLNSVLEPQLPCAPRRTVADRGTSDRPAMRRVSHAFAGPCRRSIRLFRSFAKRLSPSDGLGDLGIGDDAVSWMSCLVRAIPRGGTNCHPWPRIGATAKIKRHVESDDCAGTRPPARGNFVLGGPPFRRIC
jgi:hypothetical protein